MFALLSMALRSYGMNEKPTRTLPNMAASLLNKPLMFFDPFLRIVDASRNDEARDAIIGFDALNRILFVVHIQIGGEEIRIISARKATQEERKFYDS